MNLRNASLICLLLFGIVSCTSPAKEQVQKKEKIKIACVGNSITEGYGLANQSETAYPVVLNKLLGDDYAVLNCGRSATTLSKTGDFPYWITKEFNSVFVFEPDIIIIKLGTNDTKSQNWNAEAYLESYQAMIDTFNTIESHPEIYVCLPVPVFESNWNEDSPERNWGINDSTVIAGIIPAIKRLVRENNLEVIDLFTTMQDYATLFPDGIHPNEAGAAKIAEIIAGELEK